MFGQDADFFSVLDDGDAAALTVVEFFSVVQSFSAPDGVHHGGIPVELYGDFLSFHGLEGINLRAGRSEEAGSVEGITRLGEIEVVGGEDGVDDLGVFVLPASVKSFDHFHDLCFSEHGLGVTSPAGQTD